MCIEDKVIGIQELLSDELGDIMRNRTVNFICFISAFLMIVPLMMLPSFKVKAADGTIDDFVERCYTVTLDRGSEPEGFEYWKNMLLNGESVGINIAYGFVFSEEYTNKNKSDEEYVNDLYALFMGREADEEGFNYWMEKLNSGETRLDVFAGFANSAEFYNICKGYGITAGWYVERYDRNQVNNVNLFVERLYKICLGRIGDQGGQKNWVESLLSKQITGVECARRFIQSSEYIGKKLRDDEYVENLYLAMMGRTSDEEGKANWLAEIRSGDYTRDEIFEGFANSTEFGNICNSYGIDKGTYTATSRNAKTKYEVVLDKEMFNLINAYRVENGLPELSWNEEAEQVAKDRIKAIAVGGEFSHSAAGGPPEGFVAENLFRASNSGWSSEEIFNIYKGSAGHDANMKNIRATSCVIATCYATKSFNDNFKWTAGQWNVQIYY